MIVQSGLSVQIGTAFAICVVGNKGGGVVMGGGGGEMTIGCVTTIFGLGNVVAGAPRPAARLPEAKAVFETVEFARTKRSCFYRLIHKLWGTTDLRQKASERVSDTREDIERSDENAAEVKGSHTSAEIRGAGSARRSPRG